MRRKLKDKRNLSPDIINKLGVIFEEKGWEINDDSDFSLFYRFCDLLSKLNLEQQNFIIELTSQYQKLNFDDYIILINDILNQIAESLNDFSNINTFYIMPLVSEKDKNNIKSSTLVAYLFQSPQIKYTKNFSKINFKVRNELTPKEINKINESPKTMLMLVDDFIGTGETAIDSHAYYVSLSLKREKIFIVSLVSQEIGYNLVKSNNIEIYSSKLIKRALTDNYSKQELERRIKLMTSIEEIVGPKEEYNFGYKGSEALITLVRTPNNTFPVFWLEKNKGHKAPFPRGGN